MRKAAVYTIRRPEQPVPLQDARKKQTFLAEKVQRVQATYDGYKNFLGETDKAAIAAKQNPDVLMDEYQRITIHHLVFTPLRFVVFFIAASVLSRSEAGLLLEVADKGGDVEHIGFPTDQMNQIVGFCQRKAVLSATKRLHIIRKALIGRLQGKMPGRGVNGKIRIKAVFLHVLPDAFRMLVLVLAEHLTHGVADSMNQFLQKRHQLVDGYKTGQL